MNNISSANFWSINGVPINFLFSLKQCRIPTINPINDNAYSFDSKKGRIAWKKNSFIWAGNEKQKCNLAKLTFSLCKWYCHIDLYMSVNVNYNDIGTLFY